MERGQYAWDTYGHLTSATTPYGTTTAYTWNYSVFPFGELTKVQEGTKSPTTLSYYEPSGNIQQITYPKPGTTGSTQTVSLSATWSPLGNLLTVTAPGNASTIVKGVDQGITTTYNYTADGTYNQAEALGEPISITDNLGKTTHLRYTQRGQVSSAIDALGNETDAAYYLSGQTQQVTLPATGQSGPGRGSTAYTYLYSGGPLVSAALSDEGNLGLMRIVNPHFGAEGELLSVTGNLNSYTVAYDALYRPQTVTDASNNVTSYMYMNSGALAAVTYPNGDGLSALTWDHNDNVLTAANGRGQLFTYVYNDNESRLTQVLSADVQNNYIYDSYGRLKTLVDIQGGRTFTYDDDDLPQTQTLLYTALPANATFTSSYSYNNDGSRSGLSLTNAGTGLNLSWLYSYNGRGDLTGLTTPYSESLSWSYLDNGWLQSQTSSAAVTSFSYNATGQLLDLNNSHGGTTLSDFNLAGAGHYDGAGNVLGQTATLPGAPASYSGSTSYQYDGSDQLVNEQSGRLGSYNNVFAYDASGNPKTWKGAAQTFNPDNQNNAGAFDNDGNPTSWQGNNLTFDTANHLTGVGTTLTAGYNAEGLRAWKQNASGSTYFIYDGLTPIAEVDSHANVQAVNTWGVNGLASRRTVATNSSVFYTFDVQGSTAQRLDSGGNVLGSYGFDAFGTRASTDNSSDPYSGFGAQFGYYRDAETGLSLLGERYYDASQGRFLNRDPIGYDGGLNLYAYIDSNPLADVDPEGLCPEPGKDDDEKEMEGGHHQPRPSTKGPHEAGDERRRRDQGIGKSAEKADERRYRKPQGAGGGRNPGSKRDKEPKPPMENKGPKQFGPFMVLPLQQAAQRASAFFGGVADFVEGALSAPFYAPIDADGNIIGTPRASIPKL